MLMLPVIFIFSCHWLIFTVQPSLLALLPATVNDWIGWTPTRAALWKLLAASKGGKKHTQEI